MKELSKINHAVKKLPIARVCALIVLGIVLVGLWPFSFHPRNEVEWLHGEKGDVLIPMVDPPGGLKKNRAYSEEQVIKALHGIAEQNKSFHDHFREPRPKRRRKGKRSG